MTVAGDSDARAAEALALLSPFERFAYRVARFCNLRLKRLCTFYQQRLLGIPFSACVGRSVRPHGIEHVRALPPDRPLLLVSNHRSFFDFFTLGTVLWKFGGVGRTLYFPVRANFFYDHPLGLLINALIGGWAMYPPIFRDRKKIGFNRWSIEETAALLSRPGSLVGIHPEGTRGKEPDPYQFLPAQPGVGRVAFLARPIVLPVFILGLGNSLWGTFLNNWTTRRPIFVVFGPPVDLSDLYLQGDRPAIHKRIADRLLDAIRELGRQERALRAAAGAPLVPGESAQVRRTG